MQTTNLAITSLLAFTILMMGMISLGLGFRMLLEDKTSSINKAMFLASVFGFIWNFGYAWMMICYDENFAIIARGIALAGVFGFVPCMTHYVLVLSGASKVITKVLNSVFGTSSLLVWWITCFRDDVDFISTKYGYYYKAGTGLDVGFAQFFYVIAAVIILYICCIAWQKKTKYQRIKKIVKYFYLFGMFIIAGCVAVMLVARICHGVIFPLTCISEMLMLIVLYVLSVKCVTLRISVSGIADYVFRLVKVPILVTDEDGKILIVNENAYEFFQCDKKNLIGRNVGSVYYKNIDKKEILRRIHERADSFADIAVVKSNGAICKVITSIIYDDCNEVICAISFVYDMTKEQMIMDRLSESKLEAERANRAKSAFLANMSHEIRTPMNVIIGMSDIVLHGELSAEQRDQIENIKIAGSSLLRIINDVLDISKIESGKYEIIPKPYMLPSLLNDIHNSISVWLVETKVEFKMDIDPTVPKNLVGDVMRVKQILLNIIRNAVKFTQEGFIFLKVDWNHNLDDTRIIFTVQDTGIGIHQSDIGKLFKSFSQVNTRKDRKIEGTGLGLALSKNLAQMMNGDITVSSVWGEGSTFTVELLQEVKEDIPIGQEMVEALKNGKYVQKEHECVVEIEAIQDAKVLLVDDNRVNLMVAKGLLKPYLMQVDMASNGAEAIKMIEEKEYDIVFMDHMMPGLDGVDTTRIIREKRGERFHTLPIIALTANAMSDVQEEFIKAGLDDFLAKPIDSVKLDKILKKWLAK